MAKVWIPGPLRHLSRGRDWVEAAGATLGEVFASLEEAHPGLRARLFTPAGRPREFLTILVDGIEVRGEQFLSTPVGPGSEVNIVPAIGGGAPRRRLRDRAPAGGAN